MKTILTFIGHYLPGYRSGGPVRTISNMLNLLGDSYNFKIITRDRDQLDHKPYDGIKINEWNEAPKCKIFYSDNSVTDHRSPITVINNCEFDQYYLNSLFDFNYSIKIILLYNFKLIPQRPILLAPRGELLPGALSLKPFKKKLFLSVVKILGLYKNIIWHASTNEEATEIKNIFGEKIETRIALDAPDYSLLEKRAERTHTKEKGKLKILYISSITPIKNLKFAIEVLYKVEGDFIFDIYGPIKDKSYWSECLKTINSKIKDRVVYKGEIHNNEIHKVYPNYDLFFFPTLSENFGHVIWESLVFGCPVLTSNKTPWNGLENFNGSDSRPLNAGWNFPLNNSTKIKEKIEELIALSNKEYSKYNKGCSYYIDNFDKEKTLRDNINLFE